jgi:hypothetical protein
VRVFYIFKNYFPLKEQPCIGGRANHTTTPPTSKRTNNQQTNKRKQASKQATNLISDGDHGRAVQDGGVLHGREELCEL